MHLVFGVDDFSGELSKDIVETQLHIPDKEIDEGPYEYSFLKDVFYDRTAREWAYVYESLYWSPEFNSGILGMSINQTRHDSDFVRALSVFYPEFYETGKQDLPVWDKEEHWLYARDITNRLPICGDIEFQWSWFYPSVIEQHYMWPVHAYCTRWLLQQVGVDIDYRKFKAMLVWEWC
jgi:hypothetical protein